MKPKVFIGSSVNGLPIAEAIQSNLDYISHADTWDKIFHNLQPTLSEIKLALEKYDFAIFVFLPEDKTFIEGKEYLTVRDNVIFETGLFLGKLGDKRVFAICPRSFGDLDKPTDLKGVNISGYDDQISPLVSAVSPACNELKAAIRDLGAIKRHSESDVFKGIHHVNLPVKDLERSKKFYKEIFNLQQIERPDYGFPGIWFRLPNGQHLHLIELDKETYNTENDIKKVILKDNHFAFEIDEAKWRDMHGLLLKHGIEERDHAFFERTGIFQTYFLDPDLHVIEVVVNKPPLTTARDID